MKSAEHSPTRKLIEVAASDYPHAEIAVSFPDLWELVGRFSCQHSPRYVGGLPVSQERSRSNHFHGLSAEVNRALTSYRQYKLFEPRVVPRFQMAWNSYIGAGRIIGVGRPSVHLTPIGQAQVWHGEGETVFWECYLFENQRQQPDWQDQLRLFWQTVERDIPAGRVFTEPREPTFEQGYPEFLEQLGYAPDPAFAGWWSKQQ